MRLLALVVLVCCVALSSSVTVDRAINQKARVRALVESQDKAGLDTSHWMAALPTRIPMTMFGRDEVFIEPELILVNTVLHTDERQRYDDEPPGSLFDLFEMNHRLLKKINEELSKLVAAQTLKDLGAVSRIGEIEHEVNGILGKLNVHQQELMEYLWFSPIMRADVRSLAYKLSLFVQATVNECTKSVPRFQTVAQFAQQVHGASPLLTTQQEYIDIWRRHWSSFPETSLSSWQSYLIHMNKALEEARQHKQTVRVENMKLHDKFRVFKNKYTKINTAQELGYILHSCVHLLKEGLKYNLAKIDASTRSDESKAFITGMQGILDAPSFEVSTHKAYKILIDTAEPHPMMSAFARRAIEEMLGAGYSLFIEDRNLPDNFLRQVPPDPTDQAFQQHWKALMRFEAVEHIPDDEQDAGNYFLERMHPALIDLDTATAVYAW